MIGIASIVASLLFVGLQMRQEQDIASAQIWSERNQVRAELANLIYTDPQIWVNGLEGAELSAFDTVRFEAIAFLYFQKESAQYNQRYLQVSPAPERRIAHGLANMMWSYPGLRSAWSRWHSGHQITSPNNPFTADVERHLNQFEEGVLTHIEIDYLVPP